jgi:putative chitinase
MPVPLNALLAMRVTTETARSVLLPLNVAADRFGITTRDQVCGFLGQCAHESRLFTAFKEDLFYRDAQRIATIFRGAFDGDAVVAQPYVGKPEKLANRVYAGRFGNGNEASGDGWRYRGRGAIHLTFRGTYQAAGAACERPYAEQPDLLLQPDDACLSAAWFWASNGCNRLMDQRQFGQVTKIINAGMVGAGERHALYQAALTGFV